MLAPFSRSRLCVAIALSFTLASVVDATTDPTVAKIEPSSVSVQAVTPALNVTPDSPKPLTAESHQKPLRELVQETSPNAQTISQEAAPPLEIVNSEPALPTDLWDRIRVGYAMTDLDDEYVRKWEKFYSERPDYLARIVDRASKYLFYIVTEVERRGMPTEIALLPMIESAFVPHAMSNAAAAGIWQFIPSTGQRFGMKQDWWADSRRDILAATQGALDYLEKLNKMFDGDWQLALASYNWGEGSVGRAIARNRAAGLGLDYVSITNMPAETRNYLPKLQAVKNIVANPSAFGISLASIANQPYFKGVTLAKHIDVERAINLAGISKDEFLALNPAHNRPVIGGRDSHSILLPADVADHFIERLGSDDRPQVSWMAYKTKPGDKLDQIAQRFGISVDTLRAVNGIRMAGAMIPPGYNMLVPSNGKSDDALGSLQNAVFTKLPEMAAPSTVRAHRVGKGENLGSIAAKYRVPLSKLKAWNRLAGNNIRPGQVLAIGGPMPMQTKLVKVKRGGKWVTVKQTAPAIRMVKGKNGKVSAQIARGGKAAKGRKVAVKNNKKRITRVAHVKR